MYNPQIYTLIETAEAGSFAKAAERLHITPVSVMNQINALEARWGVKLFERTNRGVVLTAAGRSLCADAKRMIAESEAAVTRAREISGAELRTVKIGTSVLRPCAPLLELWKHAGEAAADFQINIAPFSDGPSDMEKMLASLGTDIDCFVSPCDSVEWMRRFRVVPLFTCKCRLFCQPVRFCGVGTEIPRSAALYMQMPGRRAGNPSPCFKGNFELGGHGGRTADACEARSIARARPH